MNTTLRSLIQECMLSLRSFRAKSLDARASSTLYFIFITLVIFGLSTEVLVAQHSSWNQVFIRLPPQKRAILIGKQAANSKTRLHCLRGSVDIYIYIYIYITFLKHNEGKP